MIKIRKKDAPQVLIDNQAIWTQNFQNAIDNYGGYDKVPKDIKEAMLCHYRHKDIQSVLAESSHYKCAFCECKPGESGNIEVEHFEPKSLYPQKAFEWNNLLPACRKCNEAKLDFDTGKEPIINPAIEEPEELLTYRFIEICPVVGSGDEEKAKNTIEVCNLNSPRLYEARSAVMIAITEYVDELRGKIALIDEADSSRKKSMRINKLRNSIEILDKLLQDDSAYSGYCRWFVAQQPEYKEAKRIVENEL